MTMNGLMKMPRLFVECWDIGLYKLYGKCSNIWKTTCLPKRSMQTGQTKIRLLLKKQSDQDLPCLLF